VLRQRRCSSWRPRPAWSGRTTRMRHMRRLVVRRRRRLGRPHRRAWGLRWPWCWSPAAAPRWPTSATPARSGSAAASSARSPGPHDRQARHRLRLARVVSLPRHLEARPGRPADMSLLDLSADDRYLQCTNRLSPVVDDRTHRNVLIFPAPRPPTRRPARHPSRGAGPACPSRRRTAVQGPACGANRLPPPTARRDARPQISRDMRYRETPGSTSARAFLPDVPGRIGVPSP
jgi:hypothetical protein